MGELREVPILQFFGNGFMNPGAFANDLVDALDAKIKGGAYEALLDVPKDVLKGALADVLLEKVHQPLAGVTIACEGD